MSRRLLAFYDARRRELPWRETTDPYRVWVSEIMLQQTRVETAWPYYARWLRRFPTLDALAEADLDDVLRCWEGLGYYARARNLHRAAVLIRERHAGELPRNAEALRALPGIGDYTAGAIASIAFGAAEPAVDGNARRVLCRLLDAAAPSAAALRRAAAALVPRDRPGDFNQALMELGATVCTPRSPACEACPLAAPCRARRRGTQELRPRRVPARPLPVEEVGTAVVSDATGRVLLRRRPLDARLGGLWEFPGVMADGDESPADAAARAAREAAGRPCGPGDALGTVRHTFSHRRVRYHAYRFRLDGPGDGDAGVEGRAWAAAAELEEYALPVAQRKVAARAGLRSPA